MMKYLHCDRCVARGIQSRYIIGVDERGNLHVSCDEHQLQNGGPFKTFENATVADELRKIAQGLCDNCEDEESVH
jgi:hypothetical protein